jgi:ABC-type phosphate transport system substrate-binding protein
MSRILSVLLSACFCLALGQSRVWAAERSFAVIAAPGFADSHLSRESIAQIFKRKQNYWENGTKIQPVNLPPTHPARRSFSQSILGHPPEAMEDYWREMYFHGVLPPHVLASEEAVILFVGSTPGAIGYVANCVPEHRVNVVLVVGDVPICPR